MTEITREPVMDAIQKIEAALAEYEAPPGNMVDRNERVMRILKAREAYTSATNPAAIREVLQALADKDAEIKDAALKHVSLFGELQNALDEIARLQTELADLLELIEPTE